MHSPGKIVTDLAVTLTLGGYCLADVAMLRPQPELFGPVASDPVVSRLVARLAGDAPRALTAIRAARAAARARAWGTSWRRGARCRRRPAHHRHRRDDRDRVHSGRHSHAYSQVSTAFRNEILTMGNRQ